MKLPDFQYERPQTVEQAVAILARHGADARPLAGGQSLMPMLAFRLASPTVLVDLTGIAGLDAISVDSEGLHVGALVRWRQLEDSASVAAANPIIAAAVPHIAHYQIRNRGTIGGSLANADPAAEMPAIAVTCAARIEVASSSGRRTIAADKLFLGPLVTSLEPGEIITRVTFPAWPKGRRWAFEEFAAHRGAFAYAGVALHYDVDAAGKAKDVHMGTFGAAQLPMRLGNAEAALNGRAITPETIAAAAKAGAAEIDPAEDIHAGAAYRRGLLATLIERALQRASA